MSILLALLVCAFIVTANSFELGNSCGKLRCNHDVRRSLLVAESLCKVEVDGIHQAGGVFISKNKVLTIAFILYESWNSKKPMPPGRIGIFLPSSGARDTDEKFAVDFFLIPNEYEHPSFKFNLAVLILKDNDKLPNLLKYPSINKSENEDERQYDLIGFAGREVMKDSVTTHDKHFKCGQFLDQRRTEFYVKVDYSYNFCAEKKCALSRPVDGGIPVVSGNVIIGIYLAGENLSMEAAFVRLSKHQDFIEGALKTETAAVPSSNTVGASSSRPWYKVFSKNKNQPDGERLV